MAWVVLRLSAGKLPAVTRDQAEGGETHTAALAAGYGCHQNLVMTISRHALPFMILTAALMAGCAESSDGAPTTVAEAFYEEMAAGNIEAAKGLSTPETADMLDYIAATHCTEMFHTIAEGGASDAVIDESSASVRFMEGGGFATVPLVKMNGEWKVDFATMMKAHMKPEPVQLKL